MLTLSALPGLVDVPDSALNYGGVLLDSLLAKISQNAKFGCVRPEFFYGDFQDGDTVPQYVSPADGYVYSPQEQMYVWALRFGYDVNSGKPSAKGQLLLESTEVDQATGQVSILKAYYVQGGAQTNTHDGILAVWTIGIRGGAGPNNLLSMAAQPAFSDIADSAFAQDVPVLQANIQALSRNAKRSIVSTEAFCDFGGALSTAAVAAGGSGYQVNDILSVDPGFSGGSGGKVKVTSVASGGGQIQQIALGQPTGGYPGNGYAVNDILTIVQSGGSGGQVQVTSTDGSSGGGKGKITGVAIYAQGSGYRATFYNLPTTGGNGSGATISILAVGGAGVVTGVSIYADPVTGSKGQLYQNQNSIGTTGGEGSGCTLNITATLMGYGNSATVPAPVSPIDGYTYSRSELNYFPFWIYTGKSDRSGPSGAGRVRLKTLSVNASTGVVSCAVTYWDGHTATVTNDGIIGVLVLATRTLSALAATAGNYVDVDDSHFWALQLLGDSYLLEVSHNAKFANLRPEIFTGTYTNGQTVSLPTSAKDSYAYSRAELQYIYSVQNSGSVPDGDILAETYYVDPGTGIVSIATQLQTSDGTLLNGGGPTLFVVTIARRAHETGDITYAAVGSPQTTAAPPPPQWLQCVGVNGVYHFALAPGAETGIGQLAYQIQLADDPAFTVNVETLSLGGDPFKTWREPNRLRYARAAAAFVDSPWSSWANFGTPIPVLGSVAGGSLPARTYYLQIQYSGANPQVTGVLIGAGGTGYNVGDILTLINGAGSNAQVKVLSLGSDGAVATVQILWGGVAYSNGLTYPTIGGAGTGCTIQVTSVNNYSWPAAVSAELPVNLAAGYLLTVASPSGASTIAISGFDHYTIFAAATSGSETEQVYLPLGQGWTEPTGGLTSNGPAPGFGYPLPVLSGNVTDSVSDYLIHQGTAPSGSGYSYHTINTNANYTVQAGDVLELDQFIDATSAGGTLGIDFNYGPTGTENRASASTLQDQFGFPINPSTSLSAYAGKTWLHRNFSLTAIVGAKIGSVASALIGSGTAFYKGRLGNVVVTNNGVVQATLYASGAPNDGSVWATGGENFTGGKIWNIENPSVAVNVGALPAAMGVAAESYSGTDIGAKINAAYAALPACGGVILVNSSASFSTPIVFGTNKKPVVLKGMAGGGSFGDAQGVVLTYTGTSGAAITLNYGEDHQMGAGIRDLTLTGPGNARSTTGILVGGSNGAEGSVLENVKVQSFGTNLAFGNNTWIATFRHCMFRDGGYNLNTGASLSAFGENILFDNCVFADAPAPFANSVWVRQGELRFEACSFDQAQLRVGDASTGVGAAVSCHHCHFENPDLGAAYDFITQDNLSGNVLYLTDCELNQDVTPITYPQFMTVNGGGAYVRGFQMFSAAGSTFTHFALVNNAANFTIQDFTDLSGCITGSLLTGTSTGQIVQMPGANPGAVTRNYVIGKGALDSGAGMFDVRSPASTNTPLNVRGASGQTADLADFRDSSSNPLASIDASGRINTQQAGDSYARVSLDARGANGVVKLGGSGVNANLATLSAAPTAPRTWTFQDATDTVVGRVTTDTLSNKTLTNPRLSASSTIQDSGGAVSMGVTRKLGSQAGNYSITSATFVDVDATNLAYTVTIPTGWKLLVQAALVYAQNTAAVGAYFQIYDTVSGGQPGVANEVPPATGQPSSVSLLAVISGEGYSHTVKLQAATGNAADAVIIQNSSAAYTPVMTFLLMPSN